MRVRNMAKFWLGGWLLGCGGSAGNEDENRTTTFFSQYAQFECALLEACEPDEFEDRFDGEEDCTTSRNDEDFCTIIDEEQAGLCIDVLETLTCEDLNGNWYLPQLLNCDAALSCDLEG